MKKVILSFSMFLALAAASFAQSPAVTPGTPTSVKNPERKPKMQKANDKMEGQAPAQTPAPDEAKSQGNPRAEGKGNRGENFFKDMGLTPDQEAKFKVLNENQKTAMDAIMSDKSLTPEARKTKIDAGKANYEAQVKGVFNAEQFAKWTEMRANRSAKGKGDRMKDADHKGDHKGEGKMKGGKIKSKKEDAEKQ